MKKLLIFLILAMYGCTDPAAQNERLTHEIFEAFNAHDWEKMASFYADEFVCKSPEASFSTRDKLLAYYQGLEQAFPDIKDEILNIYPSGNHVIIEFVAQGTAADGSRMSLPILGVLTFERGRVVRDVSYFDL